MYYFVEINGAVTMPPMPLEMAQQVAEQARAAGAQVLVKPAACIGCGQ